MVEHDCRRSTQCGRNSETNLKERGTAQNNSAVHSSISFKVNTNFILSSKAVQHATVKWVRLLRHWLRKVVPNQPYNLLPY